MPSNEHFTEYCRQVSQQIRWKRVRRVVAQELEQHLCDQQDAYVEQGHDADEAARMAVAQMGDAQMVGQALNQTHRPQTPWLPMFVILVLLAVGLVLQSVLSPDAIWALPYGIAAAAFFLGYFMDTSLLGRHAGKVYGLVLALSLLALFRIRVSLHAVMLGHSFAVLSLPPFNIMLGNLALIFPMAYGLFVYKMRNRGMSGIVYCGLAYLPFAGILLCIPTIIGFLLYTIASLVLLCTALWQGWFQVRRGRGLALVLIAALVYLGVFFVALFSAESLRFRIFLNTGLDMDSFEYLHYQAREIIAQAAFWGEGSGDLSGIPCLETDYALLYGIHRFGLGPFLALMLLSVGLCIFCVRRGLRQQSMLGKLLVLAVSTTFILQVLSYGVTNLGYGLFGVISFPFVSYGGTALVFNALLMGCMLSVFRMGPWVRDAVTAVQKV